MSRKIASFICLLLLSSGCSSSVWYTVKRQADLALKCDCGPLELEEIRGKPRKDVPEDAHARKFFHGSCCGREAFYECITVMGGPYSAQEPPLPDQGPAGDVSWRCWAIDAPSLKDQSRDY